MPTIAEVNQTDASSGRDRARSRSTRTLGDALLEHIKEGIGQAWSEEWDTLKKELRGEIYCKLNGFDHAMIDIVDNSVGDTWWTVRLRDLVTALIKKRDGKFCGIEESGWHESIASDLERQATRLRRHAAKIRTSHKST